MKRVLKTISVCMASFSEVYFANGTLIGRCTNSLKYIVDPEARARRIVNISQCADINFCKDFWMLNENGRSDVPLIAGKKFWCFGFPHSIGIISIVLQIWYNVYLL